MTESYRLGFEFGRRIGSGMDLANLRDMSATYRRLAALEVGGSGVPGYLAGVTDGYAAELAGRESQCDGYSAGVFQGSDAAEFGPRVGAERSAGNV